MPLYSRQLVAAVADSLGLEGSCGKYDEAYWALHHAVRENTMLCTAACAHAPMHELNNQAYP